MLIVFSPLPNPDLFKDKIHPQSLAKKGGYF
jgi:hypothetical protein